MSQTPASAHASLLLQEEKRVHQLAFTNFASEGSSPLHHFYLRLTSPPTSFLQLQASSLPPPAPDHRPKTYTYTLSHHLKYRATSPIPTHLRAVDLHQLKMSISDANTQPLLTRRHSPPDHPPIPIVYQMSLPRSSRQTPTTLPFHMTRTTHSLPTKQSIQTHTKPWKALTTILLRPAQPPL